MMHDPLWKERFTLAALDLEDVQGFHCGDAEWDKEAANWLNGKPATTADCAAKRAAQGIEVWLYRNAARQLVGFGSLGKTRWRVPTKRDAFRVIAVIPWVAIQKQFHSKPAGAPREERYSTQIMDDLISIAVGWSRAKDIEPYLGLCVHADNVAAIKLYQRAEFVMLPTPYKDPDTGLLYERMVVDLSDLAASSQG